MGSATRSWLRETRAAVTTAPRTLRWFAFWTVLGLLASLIVLWFSRLREFRADRGGARLAGRGSMISALQALKSAHEPLPQQFAAFGIADGRVSRGFAKLWMSHPPLDERIAALQALPAD